MGGRVVTAFQESKLPASVQRKMHVNLNLEIPCLGVQSVPLKEPPRGRSRGRTELSAAAAPTWVGTGGHCADDSVHTCALNRYGPAQTDLPPGQREACDPSPEKQQGVGVVLGSRVSMASHTWLRGGP